MRKLVADCTKYVPRFSIRTKAALFRSMLTLSIDKYSKSMAQIAPP